MVRMEENEGNEDVSAIAEATPFLAEFIIPYDPVAVAPEILTAR